MTDPDLKKELDQINNSLDKIKSNTRVPVWRSFFTGMLTGLGSVIGAAAAIIIIGWILNTIGVIPAFKNRVNSWQQTIESLGRNR